MTDDTFAWQVIQRLRRDGIRVPDDVSIMTDGSPQAPEELTMWECQIEKLGCACVRLLKRQFDGDSGLPRQATLYPRLRRGRTVKVLQG
jgi:DNA-binding LacI/PurR family transcriptional regulator